MPWFLDPNGRGARRYRLAAHEAGHACMALHLGCRLGRLRLGGYLDRHVQGGMACSSDAPISVQDNLLITLAGPAAEVLAGGGPSERWQRDLLDARQVAGAVCRTPEQVEDLIDRHYQRALEILAEPRLWAAVEAVALALTEARNDALDGRTAARIAREAAAMVEASDR